MIFPARVQRGPSEAARCASTEDHQPPSSLLLHHPSKLEYFLLLGTAPVVVQLRPSSEHIPIVRAPGARDHTGVVPAPPS